MTPEKIRSAAEAIIFAGGTPVELSRIAKALDITENEAKAQINILIEEYEKAEKGITIIELDKSYQMISKKEFAPYIRTVMDLRRNAPLSQAALEVLAVVAYNQPVTKAFIEQVRGVDCSGVIGSLCAKELIEEKGRLELPGRPLLYGTTQNFLRCFGVKSIEELPPLPQTDDNDKSEDDAVNNTDKNSDEDTVETTVKEIIEEVIKE